MTTEKPQGTLNFKRFVFANHTTPRGFLPMAMGAQACWYFYTLAHKMWQKTDQGTESQIIYEDEPWMSPKYEELKRTIAMVYGLESPSEMDKHWSSVIAEASRCGYPLPKSRYVNAGPGMDGSIA